MLKTVDLFAGAGGLSFGFEATNEFQIVAAAENNKNARDTYIANHKGNNDILMINDVRGYDFNALIDRFGQIDVVIGGPPCQGFSNANRQKNHIISMNNSLVKEYFRAIKEIKPKAFVMENVSMLSSGTHRFYDSALDHDEVVSLSIEMKEEELIIAEDNYDGVDCYVALNGDNKDYYSVSDELLQLLNVLYKNRNNKERLPKYIHNKKDSIIKKIDEFFGNDVYNYQILHDIHDHLSDSQLSECLDELGQFIKFQKSFRLKDELDNNHIIYDLQQYPNGGKITASVKSYSVIEYVNKILGDNYAKKSGVMNSLWFGVPQERKRFIMIGIRSDIVNGVEIQLPNGKEQVPPVVCVGDAIMDLTPYPVCSDLYGIDEIPYIDQENLSDYALLMRKDSNGVNNHIVPKTGLRAQQRFNKLKEGENFHKLTEDLKDNYADPRRTQRTIYLRLDSTQPSGTVVNVRKSMWIHPTLNRAISVREAARLQSFPDRFIFKGPKDSQYQQVGNAVPPLMAKGIAETVLRCL